MRTRHCVGGVIIKPRTDVPGAVEIFRHTELAQWGVCLKGTHRRHSHYCITAFGGKGSSNGWVVDLGGLDVLRSRVCLVALDKHEPRWLGNTRHSACVHHN